MNTRTATIHFQIQPDPLRPQLQHLMLSNTMNQPLSFQGQRIEFAPGFIEGVKKCLEPFTSDRYSTSRRVGPKELWGPAAREQRYLEAQNLIEGHAAHFAVSPERLRQIKSIVAQAFGRSVK